MPMLMIVATYIILFYSVYKVIFRLKTKNKKNRLLDIMEINLLEQHFKVEVKKIGLEKLLNIVALSNAVIFTIVLMSTILIKNLILRIVVMFILLLPLIYIIYYGVSIYLKKKGIKK